MNYIFRHSPEQPSCTSQRQGASRELKSEIARAHTVVPIDETALSGHVRRNQRSHKAGILIQSHLYVFHRTDVTSASLHTSHLKQQKLIT